MQHKLISNVRPRWAAHELHAESIHPRDECDTDTRMGADFTVIKGCRLQVELGDEAFAAAVKRRVQLAGLEARRSEIEAASGRSLDELSVTVTGIMNWVR